MFLRCNESVATTYLVGAGGGYSELKINSVHLIADSGIPKQSWISFGIWLFQWGLSNNNIEYTFSIIFSSPFIAVCIGYANRTPDNGDGAPIVKIFTNEKLLTNTGFYTSNKSYQSFFIALGI